MKPRRGASSSFKAKASDAQPPAPSWKFVSPSPFHHLRDSVSSLPSSRRSSAAAFEPPPISDKAYQSSALRSLNSFLDDHKFPLTLRPLPSVKDITETFRFLLRLFDWDMTKMEEDLPSILKCLGCPLKLNKSALKAPGTPHSWPPLLSVLHWLVQALRYKEYLVTEETVFADNEFLSFVADSYGLFMRNEDEKQKELDLEFVEKVKQQYEVSVQNVEALNQQVAEKEAKVQAMRTEPSRKETLEKKKVDLDLDREKFHKMINEFENGIKRREAAIKNMNSELEAKMKSLDELKEEIKSMRAMVEAQSVNVRDVEKMRRELQAVEAKMDETELARNVWEEKSWDIDTANGNELREMETLMAECNQAIKRLKVRSDLQFKLNAEGTTPVDILGLDYKRMLRPVHLSFIEDVKKSSKENLEVLVALQKQLHESSDGVDAKRKSIAELQATLEKAEMGQISLKKDMEDYVSKCEMKAESKREELVKHIQLIETKEKEVQEALVIAVTEKEELSSQYDEEIRACGSELLQLVVSIVDHKEHVQNKLSTLRKEVHGTAETVAETLKASWSERWNLKAVHKVKGL